MANSKGKSRSGPKSKKWKPQMKNLDQETAIEEPKKAEGPSKKGLEGGLSCTICKKSFPFEQSLCEHMRDLRGRPFGPSSPDQSSVMKKKNDDDDDDDGAKVELVKDAVDGLLLLATGVEGYRGHLPSQQDGEEIRAWMKKNHGSAEDPGPIISGNHQMGKQAYVADSGKDSNSSIKNVGRSEADEYEDHGKKGLEPVKSYTPGVQGNKNLARFGAGEHDYSGRMSSKPTESHTCIVCKVVSYMDRKSLSAHTNWCRRKALARDVATQVAGDQVQGEGDEVAREQEFRCVDLNHTPDHHDSD